MKNFKNRKGSAVLPMAIVVLMVVIVVATVGSLYFLYSQDKYPGCEFADNANEGNVGGVINSNVVVLRHYNYMAQTNTFTITMPGAFDQIEENELDNYKQSFLDYLGGLMTGEAINDATNGEFSVEISSGGDTVFEYDGELYFVDYEPGDVSDTRAVSSMPIVFLQQGRNYIITVTVELGGQSDAAVFNWNC
jgi:hypothetical protein